VCIWFVENWWGCEGGFEILEDFFAIIVPRELCEFFEQLDNGLGLFGQFWEKSR